jgi:hypothetical protein
MIVTCSHSNECSQLSCDHFLPHEYCSAEEAAHKATGSCEPGYCHTLYMRKGVRIDTYCIEISNQQNLFY